MSFTVDLIGFDTIQERLKTASEEVFKLVDDELQESARQIKAGAQRDAPNDQGFLVQEISYDRNPEPLSWFVVSGADYSAFVEFGTRDNRVIPPGLEQEASEVLSKATSSLSAKQAIFQWCARRGIDPKFWYPIFVKLMTEGMHPHPFFFKQLEIEKPQLLNRLEQIL